MSPFELAALARAQDALELAGAVGGAADEARSLARTAADTAEQTREALSTASGQIEAASKAAASAGDAAQDASKAAEAAGSAAIVAGSNAQSAMSTARDADQAAKRAAAQTPRLFAEMTAARLPAGVTRIDSNGHAAVGIGTGTYVSDALATEALATAHPLACFKGDGNRHFRLLPSSTGALTPEQMGYPGTGNAQPFVQAAINYAHAVGIQRIELPGQRYEMWCPIRTAGEHANTGLSGHYILVRENIALVGTGRGKTLLRCLNSEGGTNDTVTQPNMTYNPPLTGNMGSTQTNWLGSGVVVRPNTAMDFFRMENIEVDGTKTYAPPPASHDPQINLTHKGLRLQDITLQRVELRNVTFRNFGGEIYYAAGGGLREELFENCVFDGSPQCAWNPGTPAKTMCINLQAGNAYQNEIMGGAGKTFIGGRFYDLGHVVLMGGAAGHENGTGGAPSFAYPRRPTVGSAPYTTFGGGFTAERCGTFEIGSYMHGTVNFVDTRLAFSSRLGALTDVDLRVTCTIDRNVMTEALGMGGPDNLTTPIGASGVNLTPPTNVNIELTCARSELAKQANRTFQQAVRVGAKLYDAPNVTVTVRGAGAAARPVLLSDTPVDGFVWPRVVLAPDFVAAGANSGAGQYFYISADRAIKPLPGVNGIEPMAAGPFTVTMDNTGAGFVDGQVITLQHTGNNGRVARVPATGGGSRLQQDRYLINKGDWIRLRWDAPLSAWVETGYSTSAALGWTGRTAYDAPAIAPGASTSTTVTVQGAIVGDLVTALSFGNVNLQGLVARAEVTGNNTVTVWLTNPTAAAIDLPSANLRVHVTKSFAV